MAGQAKPSEQSVNRTVGEMKDRAARALNEMGSFEAWVIDRVAGFAPDEPQFEAGVRLLAHLERESDALRMVLRSRPPAPPAAPAPDGEAGLPPWNTNGEGA